MKILVTGALGFIGSNYVSHALKQGHEVIGFDNLFNASINPTDRIKSSVTQLEWENFRFYNVDITNYFQMLSIIAANGTLDAIVHLAAVGSIPQSFDKPQLTMSVNVHGFANVAQLARILEIKRFVFASSSSVYGHSKETVRMENQTPSPANPYALSKRMNELLAFQILENFVGLRFFNVYGPGQKFNTAYAPVIPRFINEEIPTVHGDGSTARDFTYVEDACQAIEKSLGFKGQEVLNIGTGKMFSLGHILTLLEKQECQFIEQRPGTVEYSCADISKAKKQIGYEPCFTFEQGLQKTVSYYKRIKQD